MSLADLPSRNLDRRELRDLVNVLADDVPAWRPHVAFSDDHRHYLSLYRDEHVDVWLLCWTASNDTGWHDHDVSSGAVRVVQGALRESNPRIGGDHLTVLVGDGESFSFGPEHIHRLNGASGGAVSIHAYSPPLCRMGQYEFTQDGLMRRMSIGYADELRASGAVPV
jgi:hypothetical protein